MERSYLMAKKVKRSPASLFGGILIAIAIFVIWMLIFEDPGFWLIVLGAAIALAVGVWIRVANL